MSETKQLLDSVNNLLLYDCDKFLYKELVCMVES